MNEEQKDEREVSEMLEFVEAREEWKPLRRTRAPENMGSGRSSRDGTMLGLNGHIYAMRGPLPRLGSGGRRAKDGVRSSHTL